MEFAKCHMEDVVVPFQATIDYSGFRVLAVAKLPIKKTEFNESGDVKRTRIEHVLGTIDRGASVQNQSKLLDTMMANYAKMINLARYVGRASEAVRTPAGGTTRLLRTLSVPLSFLHLTLFANNNRHFVKGENDLNAREVYTSVDVRGYKGKDNKFYLLNFWRALPSENPKLTPHLPSSTRGNRYGCDVCDLSIFGLPTK